MNRSMQKLIYHNIIGFYFNSWFLTIHKAEDSEKNFQSFAISLVNAST